MHISLEPSNLYFDTPVVLHSTHNDNGTTDIARAPAPIPLRSLYVGL